MKIQEMKPGISHLHRKIEDERRNNVFEMRQIGETIFAEDRSLALENELEESRWSVVSFSRREAEGLTYRQAAARLADLDSHGVAGLCIVTDAAAARIRG